MITQIILKSTHEDPFLIIKNPLVDYKETDKQFAGKVKSFNNPDDDGYAKTRVNKSKLGTIVVRTDALLGIYIDGWTYNEDIEEFVHRMVDKFVEVIESQREEVEQWDKLLEERYNNIDNIKNNE